MAGYTADQGHIHNTEATPPPPSQSGDTVHHLKVTPANVLSLAESFRRAADVLGNATQHMDQDLRLPDDAFLGDPYSKWAIKEFNNYFVDNEDSVANTLIELIDIHRTVFNQLKAIAESYGNGTPATSARHTSEMTHRRLLMLSTVGTALLLAACTSHTDGTAVTPPNATTPSLATTSSATTSRLLPPRSRDIDLTGLDPCKALTTEQEKELQYDLGWQRPPIPDHDGATGAPDCGYQSSQRSSFGSLIAFVTTESADTWITDPSRGTGVPPKKITVSDFPALEITVPPSKPRSDNCQIVVDVHDGQYINVFSSRSSGKKVTGAAPFCAEAKRVAAMAIQTAESS